MVLGRLKVDHHYVDFVFSNKKYEIKCSCNWKLSTTTRTLALGNAYMHLIQMAVDSNV